MGENRYVLAGVVAGGIGCGKAGIPGAYASVAENLCFIDWATKCKDGRAFQTFYNFPQCDDWMKDLKPTLRGVYLERAIELEDSCPQGLAWSKKRRILRLVNLSFQ